CRPAWRGRDRIDSVRIDPYRKIRDRYRRGMSLGTVAMALAGAGASEPWELYELSIVTAVFGTPQPDLHDPWYELRLCAPSPGERSFGYGISVSPTHDL